MPTADRDEIELLTVEGVLDPQFDRLQMPLAFSEAGRMTETVVGYPSRYAQL